MADKEKSKETKELAPWRPFTDLTKEIRVKVN